MDHLRPVAGFPAEVVGALGDWLADDGEPEPLEVLTSGSTGEPKRVLLSRRAVVASAQATARRLGGPGRWLLALPIGSVAGLQVIVRSLLAGEPPVMLAEQPSLAEAVDAGARYGSLVPTQLHRYLMSPPDTAALRGLDAVLLGGGAIDPVLRAGAEAAGIRVVSSYGATETAGGCVYDGVPLDGVAVALDAGGRIRISGPVLFDGYADDPELTAATLVDGWFRTADAGHLDEDGRLQVLGRLDDTVISGGVNVPLPVVAARLRTHPGVRAAEVVGVPDAEWGQRVVAFVVGQVSLDEARDWVARRHPRAWGPREVQVVDDLPLLPNGKVDRLRLQALAR